MKNVAVDRKRGENLAKGAQQQVKTGGEMEARNGLLPSRHERSRRKASGAGGSLHKFQKKWREKKGMRTAVSSASPMNYSAVAETKRKQRIHF